MGALPLHELMHPPAVAVKRLLYGTGTGLLLGAGLALQNGHSIQEQPPLLAGFLVLALGMIAAGWSLSKGFGPLAQRYSQESDEEMAKRVQAEVDDLQRSEEVNAKWARLEANVLSKDLGEEE
jgi:hypothetical protein